MATCKTPKEMYEKYYDAEQGISEFFVLDSHFAEDVLLPPLKRLFAIFSSGAVKGDLLIQYGGVFNAAALFPACKHFKDIIFIDTLDSCIRAAEKWLNKEPGARDWSPVTKILSGGEGSCEMSTQNEEKLRQATKRVIKAELSDSHPLAPRLPNKADCLYTSFCLEFVCQDREGFKAGLKDMSSLIKIGGCLLMSVILNSTFVMVGECKFPTVYLDKNFVQQTVIECGYSIKECVDHRRVYEDMYSTTDFTNVIFIFANKDCEVQ